jgi:hypothetical protein
MSASGRRGPVPASPTARAQPFYCPYCGEQEFRPVEEPAGALHCGCCERRYLVSFLGLGPGGAAGGPIPSAEGASGSTPGT